MEATLELQVNEFKKYQHIERFGTDEVEGIEIGTCYVFPKLDGTNGSVWISKGKIYCGSRRRVLSIESDNQGFMNYIVKQDNIREFLEKYPQMRLYGEWLIPHTLKDYRDDAWKKFYVFDVGVNLEGNHIEYVHYDVYKPILERFNILYIPPLAIVRNGTYEQFVKIMEGNTYLMKDGFIGEGIVIKNYAYKNKYGRQTWAKIVRSEFKDIHRSTMGVPRISGPKDYEQRIVDKYCTEALINKTYAKIVTENNDWNSKMIPQLFGRVYHDLITEECWNFIKEFKNPIINFGRLHRIMIDKIKEIKPELF